MILSNIIEHLSSFCFSDNFAISRNVQNLLDGIGDDVPSIAAIKNIDKYSFYYLPQKITFKENIGFECCILSDNQDIFVSSKNCKHLVSLKAHICWYQINKKMLN